MIPQLTPIGFAALLALVGSGTGRTQIPSSFYLEGALVHHVPAAGKSSDFPVIMVPGLNLSSYLFLATPDGRPGWAQQFAGAGHDVYVINDPRFDFSRGFGVPGFQEVPVEGAPPADPDARQGWQQDIWRRWGFGPAQGDPYPGGQFPTDHFDQFAANYPYLSSGGTSFAQAIAVLLERVGPAILMVHSAGGPQGLAAAKAHPDLVAGLVLVEPTGPPTAADFPSLSGMVMLGVYGDHIDSRRQGSRKAGVEAAAELFDQNGGIGEVISLPEDHHVSGNSHLMMQDKNSDFIAGLILTWLAEHAKTPPPGAAGDGPTRPLGTGAVGGGMGGRRGLARAGEGEAPAGGGRPGMGGAARGEAAARASGPAGRGGRMRAQQHEQQD